MNKYQYLIEQFKEKLGDNFNLVFNNDEELTWEQILIKPELMISGVAHVNSGAFDKVNGYSVATQQMSIQFMIPTDTRIFSEAIQTIEDVFKWFHNQVFEYNNEVIKVLFNYTSDTAKVLVNGTDYATQYVYLNLISVENAIMSNVSSVKIDDEELKGVFHISYTNNHSADSIVKPNVSLMQLNNVNAIQQVLTIDLVAINDELIKRLLLESNEHKVYDITYYNGLLYRTFEGYLVGLTEEGTFNDTLKIRLTFGVANV